jgi:hypothetical protein
MQSFKGMFKVLLEEKKKKEQEILPKLVEECVSWARKLGLNKVIKTNIHAFLDERNFFNIP